MYQVLCVNLQEDEDDNSYNNDDDNNNKGNNEILEHALRQLREWKQEDEDGVRKSKRRR